MVRLLSVMMVIVPLLESIQRSIFKVHCSEVFIIMQGNIFFIVCSANHCTHTKEGKQSCLPLSNSAEKPYLRKMKLCQTGEGLSQAINSF